MTLPSQSDRLVWGMLPGGLSEFAHSFMVFGSTNLLACKPLVFLGVPDLAREATAKCPGCLVALEELDAPYRPAPMPGPGEQPYSVHRHQKLIDQVAAEFDAAGGKWAALQARPLHLRPVRREFEAVLRQHHDNFPALQREATGYLECALEAAYQWGRDDQRKEDS